MSSSSSTPPTFQPPSSILILGTGVFGLSTALALTQRPLFASTKITILDRTSFPNPHASSIDTSRIIRADYSIPCYAALAAAAQTEWRNSGPGELGGEGRYTESGLVLVCERESKGEGYVRESLENVRRLAEEAGDEGAVEELESKEAIEKVLKGRVGGEIRGSGDWGYINHRSGWADAEATMGWLRRKVEDTGRVEFVLGEVVSLIKSPSTSTSSPSTSSPSTSSSSSSSSSKQTILGATLSNGTTLHADLTILATGAWTGSLIDLRGRATATSQVLAYMDLSPPQAERLLKMPVLLNMSSGMFVIPPAGPPGSSGSLSTRISTTSMSSAATRSTPSTASNGSTSSSSKPVLKIARHAYGYSNPTPILCPNGPDEGKTIRISLPSKPPSTTTPSTSHIPAEGLQACTTFLNSVFPSLSARPNPHHPPSSASLLTNPSIPSSQPQPPQLFTQTRLCTYTDTPRGDFLITYHPALSGVFLATGGSGHGFKFLPVVGERIVDVIQRGVEGGEEELGEGGNAKEGKSKSERGGEEGLFERWTWPEMAFGEEDVVTEDGSRGGRLGMVLEEEFRRGVRGREGKL